MKAGVIGCGRIGIEFEDNHTQAYLNCGFDVVLCDIKEGFDYTDYMEMVREEHLDMVSVCTPPETHCKIVCDIAQSMCLPKGARSTCLPKVAPYVKGIYCEKPIATTLEDADKMIEACYNNNVILQVNHQRRFVKPLFRFARGILNTGTHVFDTVNYYFKDPNMVEYEFIDSDEFIFELKFRGSITEGVKHLIECIREGKQSKSSGEDARDALRMCLEFQKGDII